MNLRRIVSAVAERRQLLGAIFTLSTSDLEGDNNSVSWFEFGDVWSNSIDFPHELKDNEYLKARA